MTPPVAQPAALPARLSPDLSKKPRTRRPGTSAQNLFLMGTASLALHAADHYAIDGAAVRVAEVAGLAALNGLFALAPRPLRGGVALALGVLPTFGAFAGHVVPYLRTGRVTPASRTAVLNLGGGLVLAALGAALLGSQDRRA